MRQYEVKNFDKGLINSIEAKSIPPGAASDSLNWTTKGDKIELRRGMKLLGTEQTGTGKVTGLHVARKIDGTEILIRTRGKKIEYYDTVTSDWIEIGSDQLGTAADGEGVSFADYHSLAGAQVWLNSPNSSLYKILTANIASIVDQYDSTKNYKGRIGIKQNRMFLFNRLADKTGIYGSKIDTGTYTTVSAEAIGGSGATRAGTLAFKAAGAKRTCFAVTFTDGTETFTDNYDGTLTGSAGGTGTINYATGAYSVTFAASPGSPVTSTYQWEDSTVGGIADFTKSATRLAAEGFVFRQDDGGGDVQTVLSYRDVEYCIHEFKTWALTLTATDTAATNLIYRERVGISNWRAAVPTGDGIYYIDDSDSNDPKFRILTLDSGSSEVIPLTKSANLDLSNYRFDKAVSKEWGDYILFACRHKDSTENNTLFAYNKVWKSWDRHDYYISCMVTYGGALVAGDSTTDNVYELFSGFDDDDSLISNYWISNLDKLKIDQLKKSKKLVVKGEIAKDQSFNIYLALDNNNFYLAGTVNGSDSCVDLGQAVTVGSVTIGSKEVGGGSADVVAYNFYKEIDVKTDKFEEIKIKFMSTEIGYVSVSSYIYKDLRLKGHKIPSKYR